MLEIKLVTDRETLLPFCQAYGQPFGTAFYLYQAVDKQQVLASGLFEVGGDCARIVLYETTERQDQFLLDGILRAGLNYADSQGIPNGEIPDDLRETYRDLFSTLNYPPAAVFNIENFFLKYKNCRGIS